MDKLLDIEKGKLDPEGFKCYRFTCDCMEPEHAMDICVESWGKDNDNKYINVTLRTCCHGFWERLKYAVRLLRGHITWCDFVPRKEDYDHIAKIFDTEGKFSDLP